MVMLTSLKAKLAQPYQVMRSVASINSSIDATPKKDGFEITPLSLDSGVGENNNARLLDGGVSVRRSLPFDNSGRSTVGSRAVQ